MNAIHSQFLHFPAIDALMTQLISGQHGVTLTRDMFGETLDPRVKWTPKMGPGAKV